MDERIERTEITADYVLQGIKGVIERAKADNDHNPELKGYELLGKHLKLFTEKQEITGKDGGPIQQEISATDQAIIDRALKGLK